MKITTQAITLKSKTKMDLIKLTNSKGIEVEILTWGGIIKSIKTPDKDGKFENILVEFEDLNTYAQNPGYINALIGRTAGRIHKAEVTINQKAYKLAKNDGNNGLHGGTKGLDKKLWAFKDVSSKERSAVELSTTSLDGEEGYPGNLEIKVTYGLDNEDNLTIDYQAISDQDTIINLTNHGYFNLSGDSKRPVTDQELMIKAQHFCELDDENIVTGKLLDVRDHKAFDFRLAKPIGQDIGQDHYQLTTRKGYDHPWVLDGSEKLASLYDPISGRGMEVSTDQKVLVIYTMNWPEDTSYTNGLEKMTRYGITFEAQNYPIGHKQCFRDESLILAGEKYTQKTSFKFMTR